MKASLHALLSEVIDYAGLFPPAKLPFAEAIRNYARYRTQPESWMLGRFICPTARLEELSSYQDTLFASGPPLAVSALGRPAKTAAEFLANLRADLEAIHAFCRRHGEGVLVDALELSLPEEFVRQPQPIASDHVLVQAAELTWDLLGPTRLSSPVPTLYFEAPIGPAWRDELGAVVDVLGDLGQMFGADEAPPERPDFGFKLRCGGLTAAAFPSAEQVAFVLRSVQEAGLAFKATAGLHHPLRRFDATMQTKMHGFLNLLVAGLLSFTVGIGQFDEDAPTSLSEDELRALLEDERADSFVFTDDEVQCLNPAVPITGAEVDVVTMYRHDFVTAFGSCSFDEPRDDLRALGLLP